MREHLFRGKRTENGEWIEGFYAKSGDKHFILIDNGFAIGYVKMKEVIPETVGEYTGLTDKNSKRIFEGDIVKTYNKYVAVIIFESGMFLVKCSGFAFTFTPYECTDIEVIGTIYDNPELLEVKE